MGPPPPWQGLGSTRSRRMGTGAPWAPPPHCQRFFPQDQIHRVPSRTVAGLRPRGRLGTSPASPGNGRTWKRRPVPHPCGPGPLSPVGLQRPSCLRDAKGPGHGCAAAAAGPSRAVPVSDSRQPGRIPRLLHGTGGCYRGWGERGPTGPFARRASLVLGARTWWGVAQGPRRSLGCRGHGRWLCRASSSRCCRRHLPLLLPRSQRC